MQRSEPSPGLERFFQNNTALSYFLDVSQHVTQPSQGRISSSRARNKLLITYQVGRIRSVSNIMPFNGTLNQPIWREDTILP